MFLSGTSSSRTWKASQPASQPAHPPSDRPKPPPISRSCLKTSHPHHQTPFLGLFIASPCRGLCRFFLFRFPCKSYFLFFCPRLCKHGERPKPSSVASSSWGCSACYHSTSHSDHHWQKPHHVYLPTSALRRPPLAYFYLSSLMPDALLELLCARDELCACSCYVKS